MGNLLIFLNLVPIKIVSLRNGNFMRAMVTGRTNYIQYLAAILMFQISIHLLLAFTSAKGCVAVKKDTLQ